MLKATQNGILTVLDFKPCEQWVSVDGDLLRHFELAGTDGVDHSATS